MASEIGLQNRLDSNKETIKRDEETEERNNKGKQWLSRLKRLLRFLLILSIIMGYFVYLTFALLLNFQKTIPLLTITCVVCFLVLYHILRIHFGEKISSVLRQLKCSIKSLKRRKILSISIYGGMLVTLLTFVFVINRETPANLISLAGICVFLIFSWMISYHKKKIDWHPVIWGLAIQFLLGLFVLRTSVGKQTFSFLGQQVEHFLNYVTAGVEFVFGKNYMDFEFAFKLMPTVIFVNSAVSILYHFNVMQMITEKIAVIVHYTMATSAAETMCTAASIFLGQPEAALTIRPYLPVMTHSELHAIMTAGFASVTADIFGMFVAYGTGLQISSSHILTAVLMSAPAGLAVSKIVYPEIGEPKTKQWQDIGGLQQKSDTTNVLDAAAKGAQEAVYIVFAVGASLIAFLSILSFINAVIAYLGSLVNIDGLSLDSILSYILIPVVYLMGVPWDDCRVVGEVVGLKTVINEFVGYERLGSYIQGNQISKKAEVIATYALCGFSNPTTIGITIGGLGALIPERRKILSELVVTSWISGSVACFLTACFAGVMYEEFPDVDNMMRNSTTNLTTSVADVKLN